jgi:predicted DNA-binding protein (MmcQ/YjbR family)
MITLEEIRSHCLQKQKVTEDFPFDKDTLAFRVGGKIFLLTDIDSEFLSLNLKSDPHRAIELRDRYPDIIPGYHMNKRHWNTVFCEGDLPRSLIFLLIDESYELVVSSLSIKVRMELFGPST